MAGESTPRRPHWWPSLPEFFEDFPFDLRSSSGHMIRVEESTEEGAYVVRAELPGIDPAKDVEITVEDGTLTVKAERTEEKKDKHRSEFRYGSFQRSVRLPAGAKEEDVTASYENGVLTVKAPLGEVAKQPRKVEISTGT
ncbi:MULTISPECIES: Hsp20/alpha crystallin family protein [Kitasatospora]|jgi:HSP20 family molecular chaperone IbpA|uniref:Hsp20/alpha crystallin family protein n=1 Tax=Kitasatospora TaxID=2063 RepID=UPI000C6FEFBB|nr:Hsp20/alpha crystallin family protein [Kitasatospora sp. GP30]MDH6144308.1 HSP20 family protein [Kitasatospora sp. GP30]